jgi:type IV secretion system protein TrbI
VTDAFGQEERGPLRPPQEMRPRVRRAPVTRLSRKVLLGLGAPAALGIGGALFIALKPQHRTAGSELYNTDNRNTADGLATLPKDYTGLPKSTPQLGPPLPGDLGRPILNAGAPAPGMSMPTAGSSPEEQRIAQEQKAARVSRLFATTNVGQMATTIGACCSRPRSSRRCSA